MEHSEDDLEGDNAGDGIPTDLLRSYLAFGRRSVAKRWGVSLAILMAGLILTGLVAAYLPRTFSCTTVLMTLGNPVLDARDTANGLTGAEDLILRHENLEAMIKSLNLVEEAEARRPPILRLKDRVFRSLLGEPNTKIKIASLVGTLETRIAVTAEKGDLTIKAEWTDGKTATELAEGARQSFLKARHSAEISAFEEKMDILDGHATKLRVEIGTLAQQLKSARDAKLSEVRAESRAAQLSDHPALPQQRAAPVVARHAIEPDTQTPALRERLNTEKAKLAAAEAEHDRRVAEAQSKFEEMKLRLTVLHPEVITQGERVAMAQQIPSELALERSEVKDIEDELRVRSALDRDTVESSGGGFARPDAKTTAADILPEDINELLQRDNLDPALTAQLSGTVMKYTTLRDDLLSTRVDLDTAQAAFNHRYQVIVPAEAPNKPDKPKPAVVWGVGFFLSLLLALAAPVLSEMRRGILSERWQVQELQLPVLAELRLPPYSPD